MSLANKYRPASFDEITGQNAVKNVLSKMLSMKVLTTPLIFEGPRGTGKTSTARLVAKAMRCTSLITIPCLACDECQEFEQGRSLGVDEIDGASNGLVDDIRRIQDNLQFTWGAYRTIIIDEAQSLSRAAFNALLKVVEEPPANVLFIFVTTEPNKIPETISSRCLTFTFKKVGLKSITEVLQRVAIAESISLSTPFLTALADRADGSIRDALHNMEKASHAGVTSMEQYRELTGEVDFAPGFMGQLVDQDIAGAYNTLINVQTRVSDPVWAQDQIVGTLKDVLILHAGGVLNLEGEALKARKNLQTKISTLKAIACMKILWDSKVKTKSIENPSVLLDVVVALLYDVLGA